MWIKDGIINIELPNFPVTGVIIFAQPTKLHFHNTRQTVFRFRLGLFTEMKKKNGMRFGHIDDHSRSWSIHSELQNVATKCSHSSFIMGVGSYVSTSTSEYLLTLCVDWFGGGGFFSNKAANISSLFNSMSEIAVNSGESHRLFDIGSSYRKVSASNISLEYGTGLLFGDDVSTPLAPSSPIVSTLCRFWFNIHAFSAEIAQCTVHCVVLAALLAQYSSYR